MQKRKLGNSDLSITPIGIGAWAMGGGGWAFAWGPQDDDESIAAIHRALDRGVNWIDTAAVYGLGHSEEVVARALAGMTDRPYVFTKCLQVDVIDLYQVHWPDPDEDVEEGWRTMCELRDEGKIRHAGVSNFSVEQM